MYFPVMWFSLDVEATEKFVNDLKTLLSLTDVFMYIGVILLLVGSLTIFTVALLNLLSRQRVKSPTGDKVSNKFHVRGCRTVCRENHRDRFPQVLMYLDTSSGNDDAHVRIDRKLYPSSIEGFSTDLQSKGQPGK